jgi:hypothetical protein
MALFDPARHEPLSTTPWRESLARDAIRRIAASAVAAFDPAFGWRMHPLDDPKSPDDQQHSLYVGSGGAIWALEHLARCGAIDAVTGFEGFVSGLVERNRVDLADAQHGHASFLVGDAGLMLLEWTFTHDQACADRLFDTVRGNLRNPVREALWGSPGTVLAAIHMAEATGQDRWRELVREAVQIIVDEMEPDANAAGAWVWVQDLYGRRRTMLGAGHGFVGNVYPALRAASMLDAGLVSTLMDRALHTLQVTALRRDGAINWHPVVARRAAVDEPGVDLHQVGTGLELGARVGAAHHAAHADDRKARAQRRAQRADDAVAGLAEHRPPPLRPPASPACGRPFTASRDSVVLVAITPSMPFFCSVAAITCTCASSRSGAIFTNIGTRRPCSAPASARRACSAPSSASSAASLCSARRFLVLGLEMLTVT